MCDFHFFWHILMPRTVLISIFLGWWNSINFAASLREKIAYVGNHLLPNGRWRCKQGIKSRTERRVGKEAFSFSQHISFRLKCCCDCQSGLGRICKFQHSSWEIFKCMLQENRWYWEAVSLGPNKTHLLQRQRLLHPLEAVEQQIALIRSVINSSLTRGFQAQSMKQP